ncbi:predicted protein [Chaetoceros tenuissimus]|uniref:Uncharacterized protein n=1 Tax=Chaetoceros tenuissimus TaxID=426638 RepID=A0AAD3H6V1_9STRA|nr:predicted protein [Chaetoceros tenuissimus]
MDLGLGKIYLYYKYENESKKEKHEATNELGINVPYNRVQLAKERVECRFSFEYGEFDVHEDEHDPNWVYFEKDVHEPRKSDDLVKEILSYFEKGLQYMVPSHLFSYKAIKAEYKGNRAETKEDALRMSTNLPLLQKDGENKEKSCEIFKHKLFEQLTYALSKSVGVEEDSDGKTYVYCT